MKIVPTSKAWHLDKIMDATKLFIKTQNASIVKVNRKRHVLVEYVLISGINDSDETAHSLGKLLKGLDVLLNVIPYNVTDVPYDYKPPTIDRCEKFVTITR
jgi:adenine C2-methylase RlmN of 23S rRNA A2503 and tRNA A37